MVPNPIEYDFQMVVESVSDLLDMKPEQVVTSSKRCPSDEARRLVCFWSNRALGISRTELSEKFGISQPAVSSAVKKGPPRILAVGDHRMQIRSNLVATDGTFQ